MPESPSCTTLVFNCPLEQHWLGTGFSESCDSLEMGSVSLIADYQDPAVSPRYTCDPNLQAAIRAKRQAGCQGLQTL